jgi:uncharacterized short protein YbdD (DUF466 family)
MNVFRTFWTVLVELAGEADYRRYCAHLAKRHPERKAPSEREFYRMRLEQKYTRPTRCC